MPGDHRAEADARADAAQVAGRCAQRAGVRHERAAELVEHAGGVLHEPGADVLRGEGHAVAQAREAAHDRVVGRHEAADRVETAHAALRGVGRAGQAQYAGERACHRRHNRLDHWTEHQRLEHVDHGVAQVAGKVLAALESAQQRIR